MSEIADIGITDLGYDPFEVITYNTRLYDEERLRYYGEANISITDDACFEHFMNTLMTQTCETHEAKGEYEKRESYIDAYNLAKAAYDYDGSYAKFFEENGYHVEPVLRFYKGLDNDTASIKLLAAVVDKSTNQRIDFDGFVFNDNYQPQVERVLSRFCIENMGLPIRKTFDQGQALPEEALVNFFATSIDEEFESLSKEYLKIYSVDSVENGDTRMVYPIIENDDLLTQFASLAVVAYLHGVYSDIMLNEPVGYFHEDEHWFESNVYAACMEAIESGDILKPFREGEINLQPYIGVVNTDNGIVLMQGMYFDSDNDIINGDTLKQIGVAVPYCNTYNNRHYDVLYEKIEEFLAERGVPSLKKSFEPEYKEQIFMPDTRAESVKEKAESTKKKQDVERD